MTDLANLFLSEKDKALMLMAVDTHIREMVKSGCAMTATEMFEKLEKWVRNYDIHMAAEITKAWAYANEYVPGTREPYPADEFAQDLADSLDDDDALALYEVLRK